MSIKIENLNFTYFEDRKNILSDCNAEFHAGEITILTGSSGCGKSTLLYLAAGIYPKNAGILRSGSITVEGIRPDSLKPSKRCRLVGMMFQNPELQFCMDTVENELLFCLENLCTPREAMMDKVEEALEFCEISELKKRSLHSLSGGERQKVMLACLTLLSPKWLLLDEPFANIDDDSARMIAAKLKELNRLKGIGILAVDHRLENWLGIADRIRILEDGRLRTESMDAARPDRELLKSLGVIVPGEPYRLEHERAVPGKVVLQLKQLSLRHGKKKIFENLQAEFRAGCIYAILGQSGCGKSSLFGALSGLYHYQGWAFLEGRDIRKLRKKELGKIGFVTQNPQDQFVSDTVREEIEVGLKRTEQMQEKAEEILRGIQLWRYRDISPYMLSQGQQRRLGVAALMAYPCKVLICDEPTYAQDGRNTVAIMEALCRQARERDVALIFSTHDRQLAQDYADQILEMKGGSLCVR